MRTQVDETYSEGEIASYAHKIAFTTALQVCRDLGGLVRLPGSAFRYRHDGTQYAKPGHLAPPIAWEELPEELRIDESSAATFEQDMPWLGIDESLTTDDTGPEADSQAVAAIRCALTRRQRHSFKGNQMSGLCR